MSTTTFIRTADLKGLVADFNAAGISVAGPARTSDGAVDYQSITSFDAVVLDAQPRNSLKQFFLPPTEPLFKYARQGQDVAILEVPMSFPPRVLIGARPCDAAAVEVLDRVMNWDYKDEPWFARREATTIVTFACPGGDRSCFCTAVGLAPDATRGSDLLLAPAGDGYVVEIVTPKGQKLVDAHAKRFASGAGVDATKAYRDAARASVEGHVPARPDVIRAWVETHFEDPFWAEISMRCHGCGGCAASCPTCHCFDIVDEPETLTEGVRRRNWDTCQTSLFTMHASGHNPRHDQCGRCRQRVNHKFAIYPARFNDILCTGCGRCARTCPAGQDVTEILTRIVAMATGQGGAA